MKNKIIILLIIIFLGILFLFIENSFAQANGTVVELGKDPAWKGIVPCGRSFGTAEEMAPCTLCHLIIGIQRLFTYGLSIIIIVSLAAFFIAGIMYMVSTGDQGMMEAAKKFMISSMVGLAIVAGAWLIVNVGLWVLSVRGDFGIGRTSWFSFGCKTSSETTPTPPPSPKTNCSSAGGSCVAGVGELRSGGSIVYSCPNGGEKIENLDDPCQSAAPYSVNICCKGGGATPTPPEPEPLKYTCSLDGSGCKQVAGGTYATQEECSQKCIEPDKDIQCHDAYRPLLGVYCLRGNPEPMGKLSCPDPFVRYDLVLNDPRGDCPDGYLCCEKD